MVDEGIHLLLLVGMDHKPGPLIQQKEVFILIDDRQLRAKESEKEVILPRLIEELIVDVELQDIPLPEPGIPLHMDAVDPEALEADIFLQQGAGQKGQALGDKAVQPLPGIVFSYGQFLHPWAPLGVSGAILPQICKMSKYL